MCRRPSVLLALTILALASAQGNAQPISALVTTDSVDAREFQFAGWHDKETMLFQPDTEDAPLKVSSSSLVWWNCPVVPKSQAMLTLVDGSILAGQVSQIVDNQLTLSSNYWQDQRIPISRISNIQFHMPVNEASQIEQKRWLLRKRETHSILLSNRDEVNSETITMRSDDEIQLDMRGTSLAVPLGQVRAISIANPSTLDEQVGAGFEFSLKDGCRLLANSIDHSTSGFSVSWAGKTRTFKFHDHSKISKSGGFPELVCGIRNLDMAPQMVSRDQTLQYKHAPIVGGFKECEFNRLLNGSPIRFQDQIVPFGISMPSRSSIVIPMADDGLTRFFQFGVAIVPNKEHASVTCKVLRLETNGEWQEDPWSVNLDAKTETPVFHQIRTDNCRALALTVDFSKNADLGDQVIWLMPSLSK